MSLADFLIYGLDSLTRSLLYEQLPLYLLVFATIFICLMVLLLQVAPGNPAVGIGAAIFAAAAAWIVVRDISGWSFALSALSGATLLPLLMVAGIVIFILVIFSLISG